MAELVAPNGLDGSGVQVVSCVESCKFVSSFAPFKGRSSRKVFYFDSVLRCTELSTFPLKQGMFGGGAARTSIQAQWRNLRGPVPPHSQTARFKVTSTYIEVLIALRSPEVDLKLRVRAVCVTVTQYVTSGTRDGMRDRDIARGQDRPLVKLGAMCSPQIVRGEI